LALVPIACLASAPLSLGLAQGERTSLVREYRLAIAQQLPVQAADGLRHVADPSRQLLAARGYLRAGQDLSSRWSWSADEIRDFESSQEHRDLLAAIATVRQRFEAANPGYSLYANTQARSLDLQLQRWNTNAAVGVVANRLHDAAMRELAAGSYPARPDAAALRRFAEFLKAWRPSAAAPLAAPGLSLHGRSRAIDFQIVHDGRIIAPTEVAKVQSVWERQGWARKLAAAMRDTRFIGPLRSPNEPWHYEYGVSKP
jgi:hypothetical protein